MSRASTLIKLTLLLDALVFIGWIGHQEMAVRSGPEVRLPIEGYDPRDPISGHYLRFRLLAEREGADLKPPEPGPVELCLVEEEGLVHARALRTGDQANCPLFLAGTFDSYRVNLGVERFYVDERAETEIGRVTAGPQTYLVARVDAEGRVHPTDLVINGSPVKHH
jgi:uncharacterized membrane-anchored protein